MKVTGEFTCFVESMSDKANTSEETSANDLLLQDSFKLYIHKDTLDLSENKVYDIVLMDSKLYNNKIEKLSCLVMNGYIINSKVLSRTVELNISFGGLCGEFKIDKTKIENVDELVFPDEWYVCFIEK